MREIGSKELIHDRLGEEGFASALSEYDTNRRIDVLIDDFLGGIDLTGKDVLEVGAGLGYFSERLARRGANVTATDIGPTLLEVVRKKVGCNCVQVDAMILAEHFGPNSFDVVLSSECIEHTPSPSGALRQMARVLRPGGYLAVSTPNVLWYPVVRLATMLKARPFDGLENFSTFSGICRVLGEEQMEIRRRQGLHLAPFQLPIHGLLRWADNHLQICRNLMINLCVLAQKKGA